MKVVTGKDCLHENLVTQPTGGNLFKDHQHHASKYMNEVFNNSEPGDNEHSS